MNKTYFNYLGTVWDNLPDSDKNRFGELWHGYEQIFASVYQQFVEADLNIAVKTMRPYQIKRWLPYVFGRENEILRPPIYTSTQDLSQGVRTDTKYLLRFQINGSTPIEVNIQGRDPFRTTIDEIVSKINKKAGFAFARTIFENSIIQLVASGSGPTSSIKILPPSKLDADATEYILGIQPAGLPATFPKFPYVYALPYENIVNVPRFQTTIREESLEFGVLNVGDNYEIEVGNIISFENEPPEKLWAKKTYIDMETPWHNFGFLMNIYQKNTPSYLSVIQGLWYAFWTGPKPENIKRSLYLLFGLPVAQEVATVTRVTATEIETISQNGQVRIFNIPSELVSIVSVGQIVDRFQPLVNGIDIFDKINYPGFIKEEIGRAGIQRFLTESASLGPGDTDETKALKLLEEHTFLPQISVESFVSPDINLGNVKIFLESIKPINKSFLFQVIVGSFKENLDIKERLGMHLSADITPNLDSNQTTNQPASVLLDYETMDNPGLNLDSEVLCFQEKVVVEVYSFGSLVNTIIA